MSEASTEPGSEASTETRSRSAWTLPVALVTILVLVALDQWSKGAVNGWLDPPTNAEYSEFVRATGRDWRAGSWNDEAFAAAVAALESPEADPAAWAAPALTGAAARRPGMRAAVEEQDLAALHSYLEDWAHSDAEGIRGFRSGAPADHGLDEFEYAAWSETRPPPHFPAPRCEHGYTRRYPVLGTWLALMTTENYGAAFGQFGQFPHVLVGGRILAVLFLTWLLVRGHAGAPAQRGQGWITVAMTLVLAGAVGNLIDNLWTGAPKDGHPYLGVRDFIEVWFMPLGWDYHFPSFNVADSCISVGAVLWVLAGLFHQREAASDAPQADADAGVESSPAASS